MFRNTRHLLIGLVAVIALVGVGACTAASTSPDGAGSERGSNASDKAKNDKPKKEDDSQPFGESYDWDDGLTGTVIKVGPFKPGPWAAGGERYENHVKFTVRIVNNSGNTFDPSLAMVTVQSGNEEAEAVFDGEQIGGSPETPVLDGRETTWVVGFGVKDPKDLVVSMAPSWDHEAVIFTSGK